MAQLFTQLTPEQAREHTPEVGPAPSWRMTPLEGGSHAFEESEQVTLFRAADRSGADIWVAMQSPGGPLRINGIAIAAGLRVLAHRDVLRLGIGGPLHYYSTEALPQVVAYQAEPSEEQASCPRCRRAIEPGSPAVRCPGPQCGVWHCQSEASPCWTYAPGCALCQHPTDLAGALRWVPGDEPGVD